MAQYYAIEIGESKMTESTSTTIQVIGGSLMGDPMKARPASIHWLSMLTLNRQHCRVCYARGRRDAGSIIGGIEFSLKPRRTRREIRDALRAHVKAEHPEWGKAVDWRMERN